MKIKFAALVTAGVIAATLSACSPAQTVEADQPSATSSPTAPVTPEAPVVPEASVLTDEEAARSLAISMDPVFADPGVWENALVVSETLCDLADEAPDQAFELSVDAAVESGISGKQLGILWGVAITVYCPEHESVIAG